MSSTRTGAQVLLEAAYTCGLRVCFANPGTTELGLVRALDEAPGIRPVLGLFEGVCTGVVRDLARCSSNEPGGPIVHFFMRPLHEQYRGEYAVASQIEPL